MLYSRWAHTITQVASSFLFHNPRNHGAKMVREKAAAIRLTLVSDIRDALKAGKDKKSVRREEARLKRETSWRLSETRAQLYRHQRNQAVQVCR